MYSVDQIILQINFSRNSSSTQVRRSIETMLEQRTKDSYGPPVGKRLITFIDDLNLPKSDK